MNLAHTARAVWPADESAITSAARAAAADVHTWTNGPGDRYGEHEHGYTKLLFCVRGGITFVLSDGTEIALEPGDRLVLPPGTRHSAHVGAAGCTCIEGKLGA